MRFYCDNSDLCSQTDLTCSNTIVLGAVGMSATCEQALTQEVQQIKILVGLDRHTPIKWNLRDLKPQSDRITSEEKAIALSHSEELRGAVLAAVAASDAVLVAALIECYSTNRETILQVKKRLASYCFSDLLMRIGLASQERIGLTDRVEIVLDWPDGSDYHPFVDEYRTAFASGQSCSTASPTSYRCGSLETIGFAETPLFACGNDHPMIQVADLVAGVVRSYFGAYLRASTDYFAASRLRELLPRFRQPNGTVIGYGISVAGYVAFKGQIRSAVTALRTIPSAL